MVQDVNRWLDGFFRTCGKPLIAVLVAVWLGWMWWVSGEIVSIRGDVSEIRGRLAGRAAAAEGLVAGSPRETPAAWTVVTSDPTKSKGE